MKMERKGRGGQAGGSKEAPDELCAAEQTATGGVQRAGDGSSAQTRSPACHGDSRPQGGAAHSATTAPPPAPASGGKVSPASGRGAGAGSAQYRRLCFLFPFLFCSLAFRAPAVVNVMH